MTNDNLHIEVLNYKGRDAFVDYKILEKRHFIEASIHPPINFHSFAAASNSAFHQSLQTLPNKNASSNFIILLLLRKNTKNTYKVLDYLKKNNYKVMVSWKETGDFQINSQLSNAKSLEYYFKILKQSDYILAVTKNNYNILECLCEELGILKNKLIYKPTPYPFDTDIWQKILSDFTDLNKRDGIFVGTRDFHTSTRLHLETIFLSCQLAQKLNCKISVIENSKNKSMAKKIIKIIKDYLKNSQKLNFVDKPLPYYDYLKLMASHKIVFQLDQSNVPGQVAGDALMSKLLCVGGNSEISKIAFNKFSSENNTYSELFKVAQKLLADKEFYNEMIIESQEIGRNVLGFKNFDLWKT